MSLESFKITSNLKFCDN